MTLSPLYLFLRAARTPFSGPSVRASALGCCAPWSTCTAWGSSTATSRGERGGRALLATCALAFSRLPSSPPPHSFLRGSLFPLPSLGSLSLSQKSAFPLPSRAAHLSPRLFEPVFSWQAPHAPMHFTSNPAAGLDQILELWVKPPGILSSSLRVFLENRPLLLYLLAKALVSGKLPKG